MFGAPEAPVFVSGDMAQFLVAVPIWTAWSGVIHRQFQGVFRRRVRILVGLVVCVYHGKAVRCAQSFSGLRLEVGQSCGYIDSRAR